MKYYYEISQHGVSQVVEKTCQMLDLRVLYDILQGDIEGPDAETTSNDRKVSKEISLFFVDCF